MHSFERCVTRPVAGWKGAMWIAPLSACIALLSPDHRQEVQQTVLKRKHLSISPCAIGCLEDPKADKAHLKIKPKGKNTRGQKLCNSKAWRRMLLFSEIPAELRAGSCWPCRAPWEHVLVGFRPWTRGQCPSGGVSKEHQKVLWPYVNVSHCSGWFSFSLGR